MANHIPDEIISEILSPALRVSDATFSALTRTGDSPFMTFSESSSAFLVVSKAWLRVATPLLYSVVVLRSKAQAQALAATLKANPTLGRFIKKLRVEGGYAISMLKILQSSKNITDLFLSLEIDSSDNACGLIRGLPLVDPVRVIIGDCSYYDRAEQLLGALEKCIQTWKNLAVLETPVLTTGNYYSLQFAKALVQAPSIDTLIIRGHRYHHQHAVPEYMRIVAANPSLKRIRIESPPRRPSSYEAGNIQKFKDAVMKDPRLSALVDSDSIDNRYLGPLSSLIGSPSPSSTDDAPLSGHFVYPARLAADSVQEDAIWRRVLYFAVCCDSLPRYPRRRLAPLLVCKTFARLALPYLYTNPTLPSARALDSFASQLAKQPSLGLHVRCLSLNHFGSAGRGLLKGKDLAIDVFTSIIKHTPALTGLHGVKNCRKPITWKEFSDLSKSSGSRLQSFHGLSVSKTPSAADPGVFALFPQLRDFVWDSEMVFKTGPNVIPANVFSLLVSVTISKFEASFLDLLSHLELPALQIAVFPATALGGAGFFERHGAKLCELSVSVPQLTDPNLSIWYNCPSLTVLGVSCDLNHSPDKISGTHALLERIVFRVPAYDLLQKHRDALFKLCSSPDWTKAFPLLREVEHPHCHWPTEEREISKSDWVRWAELLLEGSGGIHLVGPARVHWLPRLKFVKKTKK
ncbi:hypothetical protein DFH06DRAFT_1115658 [Mycena polygramma]|nr:hypothetical protein DFH06DRAFT_1115658 [Mycena polygramma]